VTDGREILRFAHAGQPNVVAFSPDGTFFATGGLDGAAELVRVADGNMGPAQAMDASYIEQWRVRSKELRREAERLTYAETTNMMRGIADDYLRIADIAEAMARH
jgi:hypothetical protein